MAGLHASLPSRRTTTTERPRTLVLRSCRAPQFARAVALVRERDPEVEVVALSHRGHEASLRAAGVDSILEIPGRRFSLSKVSPLTLRRLRSLQFTEVVVPQMEDYDAGHLNLYWLVRSLSPVRVVVLPGAESPRIFDAAAFQAFLWKHTREALLRLPERYDAPRVIGQLVLACLMPRAAVAVVKGSRRRVLHVISSLGVGGAQRQLVEFVNRTPPESYAVDIVVLGKSDGEFSRAWLSRHDVRVTFLKSWPRLIDSVRELRQICRDGQYDLVHTWLFMANVVGTAAARLARVPRVIVSIRNLSLWKRTWYRRWWFRPVDMLLSRAADIVTVNAGALVRDHAAWAWLPERRIDVIPNGLDPSGFLLDAAEVRRHLRTAANLPADALVIGTTGRLAAEKDHLTFLRVMSAVHRQHPLARGIVVGDGALRADLEAVAKDMGLSHVVTFMGERQDARQLMAGFDLFLLTSIIEGFPNVLLEAAFLGVPSIASRVGGSPDVLSDAEATFTAGDHMEAARLVLAALAHRDDDCQARGSNTATCA